MTSKKCFLSFMLISLLLLCVAGAVVVYIDPFFHYHLPYTDRFFYRLDNERSQNDGIIKRFDYDAVIAGNSLSENFKTSEADELFGTHSIKVHYEGGTFREVNDGLALVMSVHPDLKLVIRSLDMGLFIEEKDTLRYDPEQYPTYLYNNNLFDDVKYVWNKDVLCGRCYPMIQKRRNGDAPGIWTFDLYGYWMPGFVGQFGKNTLLNGHAPFEPPANVRHLQDDERERITGTVEQNVLALCRAYPDTEFCYFITPYSAVWYGDQWSNGTCTAYIESEAFAIKQILESGCDNLKLFSFNCFTDITMDLDNYKDYSHYGEWINSQILHYIHDGTGLLTTDNYEAYIEEELRIYNSFDYNTLFDQEDKEDRPADLYWF